MKEKVITKKQLILIVTLILMTVSFIFETNVHADLVEPDIGEGINPDKGVSIDSTQKEGISGRKDNAMKSNDEVQLQNENTLKVVIAITLILLLIMVILVTRPHSKNDNVIIETSNGSHE